MSITDILTEANHWAMKDNSNIVMGKHIQKAIDHRSYRVGMTDDRLRELIQEGTIHISTKGSKVGQVNGLAVYSIGEKFNAEIVDAVAQGAFYIYAVSTIDEGIEVLTGTLAGELREDGSYPQGTVDYLVEKRLTGLVQSARDLAKSLESGDDAGHSSNSKLVSPAPARGESCQCLWRDERECISLAAFPQ